MADTEPKPKRALVCAGGTGGHLFPAHALASELTRRGYDVHLVSCLLYTSPSPRDLSTSRMPSSA